MTMNSKKRKRLLALFLSSMMACSFAAITACNDDKSDDKPNDETTDTTVEKDDARLTNGSFEFFNDNNGKNVIITSPTSWSRSNAAGGQTSKAASGIINTEETAWKNLTENSGKAFDTVDNAKKNWDELSIKDRLEFYDAQEKEDKLDFYVKYNIDKDDIPTCENPGTHYAETDETAKDNTNVLMIHNDYKVSGKYGTAQKFSSSTTITLQAGTYAELSLWVKTSDLKFSSNEQDVIANRGAYIDVTQTVGGTTLDTIQVKNINTEIQNATNENNGWVQYKFYLQGCSYATSTVKVTLGLGQASVSTNTWEYVSGYAFFDDVQCNVYESVSSTGKTTDWEDLTADLELGMSSKKEDKIVNADEDPVRTVMMDMDSVERPEDGFQAIPNLQNVTNADLTSEKAANGKTYVSASDVAGKTPFTGLTLTTGNDKKGIVTYQDVQNGTGILAGSSLLAKLQGNLDKPESFKSDQMVLLLSADGVAYTATMNDDTTFSLAGGEYKVVSFFVKTSDLAGHTGAGAKLIEIDQNGDLVGNETSLGTIDTTSLTGVSLEVDDENGKKTTIEDVYDGWQQCFFFVYNDAEDETEIRQFKVELTYGTTTIVGSKPADYYGGYAAFANFETRKLTKKEFGYATDSTYSKKFTLTGVAEEESNGTFFDDASTVGGKIENGFASPVNYKGVVSGSGYVNGTSTDATFNTNKTAGLVNKNELDWITDTAKKDALKALIGDATQPLFIYNGESVPQSYGFIGNKQTINEATHATVSVRVKASANATAYVYLIDMDDPTRESALSWNRRVSFWYDAEGNVCAVDPTSDEFDSTDIAFKLQSNGLYKVNEKWSGYATSGINKDDYYANLSNYEKDPVSGDLLVAENGVEYNYNAKWQNDGNDGIAFYEKDGVYYAYSNYTTPVKDLATVTNLTKRYDEVEEIELVQAVSGAEYADEWVTVTFFIHTGSQAKNYRLEVWNGERTAEGRQAAVGSYVLFDASGASTLTDDTFASYIEGARDNVEFDATNYAIGSDYENAYSFYDDNRFLRFDASLVENDVTNAYESYDATTYAKNTAYFTYEDKITYLKATFVDFNLSDLTVTPDVEEEETEDEEEESTTTPSETNMWLLISSIIIAVVLILAVISIIVRKFIAKARKNKAREIVVKARKDKKTDKKN